jgi:hypothetical protein
MLPVSVKVDSPVKVAWFSYEARADPVDRAIAFHHFDRHAARARIRLRRFTRRLG